VKYLLVLKNSEEITVISLKLSAIVTALTLSLSSLIFSTAHASTDNWPLRAKGEVRYLKFIKVYDASLFSPNDVTAETILNPNVSKCLKLDYAVSLSVDKFRLATNSILNRQHSAEFLTKIKTPLEQLQSSYKAVKKGDYYRLCYNGKTQKIRLDLNKNKLVEIQSAELAKAYLGIWLSKNDPISKPLYSRLFANNI
jgi:hypothetical protein